MKRVLILAITSIIFFYTNSDSACSSSAYDRMINSDIHQDKKWHDLLHFKNKKSVVNKGSAFFISSDGHRDAKAEYHATIDLLFDQSRKNDTAIQCMYPERIAYITEELAINQSELPVQICRDYKEYFEKVPVDAVSIVFAAEDNTYPASILGHSFLKLQGYDNAGQLREHAFSFFVMFQSNGVNLLDYVKAISGGANGLFSLSPYHDKINEYIRGEGRSLWEFELKLTAQEKERLKRHLWELKDHKINYSFTSHNCNDAMISTLNAASNSFDVDRNKFFITPLEYIDEMFDAGNIVNISILPSETERKIINAYGLSSILNTPKSTRLALSYEKMAYSYLDIDFQLIYKDLNDHSESSFHESESKMLAANIKYNFELNRFFINRIDLLKAKLFLDYPLTGKFSKYYRLSLENSLPEDDFFLGPVFELGGGMALYNKYCVVYGLGVLGYSYHRENRLYTAPEFGVIIRGPGRVKLLSSLSCHYDFIHQDNREYKFKYTAHFNYTLNKNQRIFFEYGKYFGDLDTENFKLGVAVHF